MEIINGKRLSELCDYSFGDHIGASNPDHVIGGFMKPAHPSNAEFLLKTRDFRGKIMTLFIDNIRLYNRPVYANEGNDASWVSYLLTYNDLLALCAGCPENKFVIFTSHEDTPIDEHIRLPDNVLAVHATNAVYNNDRVIPFPYGLQRPLGEDDNRIQKMKARVEKDEKVTPNKLLYINCGLGGERNAKERAYLPNFGGLDWTTCRFDKDSKFFPYERYDDFLDEMQNHKFMICPEGHGVDCHRNWESLYMRRVPVMKLSPYFARLMAGFPVLFVKEWSDVTKELLEQSDHLFQQAQTMSLKKLDLGLIFNAIVSSYENNK